MVHDQPQAAATQFMRCKGSRMTATPAKLSVTRTFDARSTHGLVVPFHFLSSRPTRIADAHLSILSG